MKSSTPKPSSGNNAFVTVRLNLSPHLAEKFERAAFACRTSLQRLWIAAMREYLENAADTRGKGTR